MAHLVYQDAKTRLELNLDGEEATGVVGFLLDLIARRGLPKPAAPAPDGGPPFQESPAAGPAPGPPVAGAAAGPDGAEPAQAEPVRPRPAPAALSPRTCEGPGCSTVFQPSRRLSRFCSERCRHGYYNARRGRKTNGPATCPECAATFKTAQALGGHMNAHTKARRAGNGKARQNGKVTTPAAPEPNRTLPVPERAPRVAKPEAAPGVTSARKVSAPKSQLKVTSPEDRPYRCKEPGCGHPCRSQGELNSHRLAYHQAEPLPVTTRVAAALTFPCPEEGCGRVYDDSNRLTHHLRVAHDHDRVDPVHVVEVHTPTQAVKVG